MTIIVTILLSAISIVSIVEIVLYGFRWYELQHDNPEETESWITDLTANKFKSFRVGIREVAYTLVYLVSMAVGRIMSLFFTGRANRVDYNSLDPHAPLVILVHGFMSHSSLFWLFKRRLNKKKIKNLVTFDYPAFSGDIDNQHEKLRDMILRIRKEKEIKRTILIGHSLGGLIAFEYAKSQANRGEVITIATLGAPYKGSYLAALALSKLGLTIHPTNKRFVDIIKTKQEAPLLSIYSKYDQFVLPYKNSHHPLATKNVEIESCGHSGFYFDKNAFNILADWLQHHMPAHDIILGSENAEEMEPDL